MQIIKPSYYDRFHCLAGACPDSCCHEWTVVVDEQSAARYRALSGQLGDRLRGVLSVEEGETILALTSDGRCPMWRQDGLCCIQAQLGADALCETCAQFPRLRHDYGDFVELGLELSCPEAARLILADNHNTVTEQQPGGDSPDYDAGLMTTLRHSRSQALALVDDRRFTPPQALAALLLYGISVQQQLDGGGLATADPEGDLAFARSLPLSPTGNPLEFCKKLNILTDRWRAALDSPADGCWSEMHRALARYFINRYWLQAVSDWDLVSRVKFTVFSCLVIKLLGGDIAQTAQLYAKEIENDPDNVEAILDGAYTDAVLTDTNLLYLLLEESQ